MSSSESSSHPFALIAADMEGGAEKTLMANSVPKQKKPNRGRIKIPIQKIQDKNKKHVTFSKRRKGLFKKATELCVLCDASVAIVTFSEAGKVFAFGHPSTDAVIHRYLNGSDDSSQPRHEDPRMPWWNQSVEELGLGELEAYVESLKQTMFNLERRIAQLDYESQMQSDSKALVKLDLEHDFRLNQGVMVPGMGNQMNYCYNNEYEMMNGVGGVDPTISFVPSDFLSMVTQYDQSDINHVALASFNRSNCEHGELERFRV